MFFKESQNLLVIQLVRDFEIDSKIIFIFNLGSVMAEFFTIFYIIRYYIFGRNYGWKTSI